MDLLIISIQITDKDDTWHTIVKQEYVIRESAKVNLSVCLTNYALRH
jgi:hypothetical protein